MEAIQYLSLFLNISIAVAGLCLAYKLGAHIAKDVPIWQSITLTILLFAGYFQLSHQVGFSPFFDGYQYLPEGLAYSVLIIMFFTEVGCWFSVRFCEPPENWEESDTSRF